MSSARKYLALALAACRSKQYEEAGVFLAQAAVEEDAEDVAKTLGADDSGAIALTALTNSETPAEETSETPAEETSTSSEEPDLEWGDEEEETEDEDGDVEESISSVVRRKSTSTQQIGKILAASMSLADEEVEEVEDEDTGFEDEESTDEAGANLIPASFSSIAVKSCMLKSPVRLK